VAKGFQISQDAHVVGVLPPVDITGGARSQAVKMANHNHLTFLIQIGVSAAAPGAITVEAGSATAAVGSTVTGNTAITFDVYKQETTGADHDVLGTRVAATTAGFTPPATDNIFYVVEIDADALPAGKPYVQLVLGDTVNSVIASAIAVLSGARYAGDQSATVTA
jgi:hypothetical protein